MRDERGNWYLLTGFAIGIILGLVYAWVISPREFTDTSPASLQPEFKDRYRAMIAVAYAATSKLSRAEARLDYLGDSDVVRALTEQAQHTLAQGDSPAEAQALGLLAITLADAEQDLTPAPNSSQTVPADQSPVTIQEPGSNPESTVQPQAATPDDPGAIPPSLVSEPASQASRPSNSTITPLPTRTPTATQGSPFVLQENSFVCEIDLAGPLIQVIAENNRGRPISGQEIIVSWEDGEDHFFTGLKPELGSGYADFLMTPGVVYQVRMSSGGQVVEEVTPAECETQGGGRYWGSWRLVFSRP